MAPKSKKRPRSSASSKVKGKGQKTRSPSPQERIGHPEDIFPLVLTSATQELFDCRTDEDVTRESPYKLLKKDNIIQDIKKRAAVSDFSPVKQPVLDYPEEEILLVFDSDFTFGQCFYLVLTPERKNKILEPPEPETLEVSENEVNKTPESKPWISLGSEKEIDEESIKETREKLRFKFSRVRRKFGTPVCFSDRNASDAKDGYVECASYPNSKFSIKQMQRDCRSQAVPSMHSSSTQTNWNHLRNAFTHYSPRELSKEEIESIINSESLKNFCISVTSRIMHALQQEEIMNVFIDDWKALETGDEAGDWSGKVAKGLMLYQAFTDQKYTKDRTISSINWHPTIHGVIAVALMEKREEPLDMSAVFISRPSFIVFFSFSDPSNPQLLLECPDDILAFDFCPSNPNIIVGGCTNGQVVLWDIIAHITHLQDNQPSSKMASVNSDTFDPDEKKGNKIPVVHFSAVSVIESCHKAPITDVQWLPPTFQVTSTGLPVENTMKMSAQIVTCSPDCTIMFWDVRLPKLPLSGRKQNVDQTTPSTTCSVHETFKYLERTWKPLFKAVVPKIDTSGEYVPLKFSLELYTSNDNTEKAAENGHVGIPDYSQLKVPSTSTVKVLEDVNTKFYVGTEDGEIVYTDWKVEKDMSGQLFSAKPLYCFNAHHYLVNTMQRSPFFKDIILTIGSWNFAIWQEGVMDGPLVLSQFSGEECTAGCWSLSRPAVFFIGKGDGSIEVWNLLENTNQPAHVYHHFTNAKITCIKPWIVSSKQHFLAVADNLGTLHVFKIPQTLYIPSRHETLRMKKYFELEKDCLKDYLKRKELWVKLKKEQEELKKKKEADKPVTSLQSTEDELKQYRDDAGMAESILKGLGLWPAALNAQDT
ncbi:dynein intermediate chain 3, axonemal [Melanotaenia boesemani]|uniref:dynein intermediate chain 3, axonemal n=1 Tax=Melanotaenia boesemani TaxID=1250792 RepID=UPI001C047468|nr:dynein intermediate chain 3, axonemal [Melanotaenia boesemani]